MNKSRIAARLLLPAVIAAAVIGGTVVPAGADPATPQSRQAQPSGDVGGLVGSLLGGGSKGGLLGGLLNGLL